MTKQPQQRLSVVPAHRHARDARVVCGWQSHRLYRADRLDLCLQQGKGRADH